MKVFVIGKRPPSRFNLVADHEINTVAARMSSRETHVLRCSEAVQLPAEIVAITEKRSITQLDILDHGGAGMQCLGDGLLFASDASPETELIGLDLAMQIEPYLTETAQVRLLGCNTGEGKAGRLLLLKLAGALGGHRIVFGMIDRVDAGNFDRDGYAEVMERQRLFSSIAALDAEAPSAMERFDHMREVRAALI
jgi:hypothetical protein